MILRPAVTILIAIISYAIFLIWNAPAAWLVAEAAPRLGTAQTRLFEAQGGAWRGSAELTFRNTDLGRLHWQASFWHLLTGHVVASFKLSGENLHVQGWIDTGGGSTRLHAIEGEAGLPLLATLVGLPVGLTGTLHAHLEQAIIGHEGALQSAAGRLEARDAKLPQLGVSLGTLALTLDTAQSEIRGRLANRGGDLDLAGTLTLTPAGDYTLHATLYPHPGQNRLADGLAALLGSPDASGRYHYNATGHL